MTTRQHRKQTYKQKKNLIKRRRKKDRDRDRQAGRQNKDHEDKIKLRTSGLKK